MEDRFKKPRSLSSENIVAKWFSKHQEPPRTSSPLLPDPITRQQSANFPGSSQESSTVTRRPSFGDIRARRRASSTPPRPNQPLRIEQGPLSTRFSHL